MEPPRRRLLLRFSPLMEFSLKHFSSHLDSSSSGRSNFVKLDNAFNCSFDTISKIIDTGMNRHMIDLSKDFINYFSSLIKDSVRIADGSFTLVSRISYVVSAPNIKLSSVSHIPHFPFNLLSINTITRVLTVY